MVVLPSKNNKYEIIKDDNNHVYDFNLFGNKSLYPKGNWKNTIKKNASIILKEFYNKSCKAKNNCY